MGIYKRKQELDQENDQENKKKRKKERKQELDQESDQEKKKFFLFFLVAFLVEFLKIPTSGRVDDQPRVYSLQASRPRGIQVLFFNLHKILIHTFIRLEKGQKDLNFQA